MESKRVNIKKLKTGFWPWMQPSKGKNLGNCSAKTESRVELHWIKKYKPAEIEQAKSFGIL